MEGAGIWEGDIGLVFVCSCAGLHPVVDAAEHDALAGFRQVPAVRVKDYLGETFAAGFPLECIAAADLLNMGVAPPAVDLQGVRKGVEVWVERRPEPLMAGTALVVGCERQLAVAAVLGSL